MKMLKVLFILALVVFMAVPAFAETQNVKVSGAIDSYWFHRTGYDLTSDTQNGVTKVDNFRSNTQVEVSAELTDNVSTVVNVVNERDWTNTTSVSTNNEFDVQLDLANVKMKEIFYAPLTLTVGRQDIWLGRGFVIGNNSNSWNPDAKLSAPEYSVLTAFDAVRATLDFNPWTIDLIYSKIAGGAQKFNADDTDLYIANVNYKFSEYNAVAEGYFIEQNARFAAGAAGAAEYGKSNVTDTIGGRVQFDPISQITLGGELAYQWGDYKPLVTSNKRSRDAYAADVFGTYRFDNVWKPALTLEYVYLSGQDPNDTTGDYGAWNSLYRGRFYTAYNDFRGSVYAENYTGGTAGNTNQEILQVKGDIKPLDDLLLSVRYSYLWTPQDQQVSNTNKDLGNEIDLEATYDYTEDVSFNFLAGWFIPGKYYPSGKDKTATDLVSSVKVTF